MLTSIYSNYYISVNEFLQYPYELDIIPFYKWKTKNESGHTSHLRHDKYMNPKVYLIPWACDEDSISGPSQRHELIYAPM